MVNRAGIMDPKENDCRTPPATYPTEELAPFPASIEEWTNSVAPDGAPWCPFPLASLHVCVSAFHPLHLNHAYKPTSGIRESPVDAVGKAVRLATGCTATASTSATPVKQLRGLNSY